MKTLVLPVLAAALVTFAAPAFAAGCFGSQQTVEKPEERPAEPKTS